jgi:hypothetical protein
MAVKKPSSATGLPDNSFSKKSCWEFLVDFLNLGLQNCESWQESQFSSTTDLQIEILKLWFPKQGTAVYCRQNLVFGLWGSHTLAN